MPNTLILALNCFYFFALVLDCVGSRYALDPAQRLVCRFYENQYPELEEVNRLVFGSVL